MDIDPQKGPNVPIFNMCRQGRSTPQKWGMVIPPLIGNPFIMGIKTSTIGLIVDDHHLLYGNNWSFDPSSYDQMCGRF